MTSQENVGTSRCDTPYVKDPQNQHCAVLLVPFVDCEKNGHQSPTHKQADDGRSVPHLCHASPLQCEQEAKHNPNKQDETQRVKTQEHLTKRCFVCGFDMGRSAEEEQDACCRHTANRQIDVEAPPPCDRIREDAT